MLAQHIVLCILIALAILPLVIWHHQKPRGQYSIIFKKILHTKTRYYLFGFIMGFLTGSLMLKYIS
jgi:hypothetical protein